MAKAGKPFAQAHRALTQHFSDGTRYFVLFRSREIVHKAGLRLLNLEGDPFARSNDLTSVLAALAQRSAWQCEVDGYLEALHESGRLLAEIVRDARRGDGAASNALWDLTAWGSPAATFKQLHARPNEAAPEAPVKLLCERYPDLPAGIRQIMRAANSGVPQAPSDDLLVQMVATALKWWPEEEEVFGERMTSRVDALRALAGCRQEIKGGHPGWYRVALYLLLWQDGGPWRLTRKQEQEAISTACAIGCGDSAGKEGRRLVDAYKFQRFCRQFLQEAGVLNTGAESGDHHATGSREFEELLLLPGAIREYRPGSGQTKAPWSHGFNRGHR